MNINPAGKIIILLLILFSVSACSSEKAALKKSSAFDPEAVLNEANEKIKRGYYEDAREILDSIKAKDTSGKYITLSQIRIADTYFNEELYEEAAIEYTHFLEIHPYHKYAPYARYQLAMSYFKNIRTIDVSYSLAKSALGEFEKLLKLYPRNPYVDIVENRIKTCKSILAEHEFYVGKFYFKKGSYEAAAGRFNNLLQNYPHSKKESEALYFLGLSYKNIGDIEKSLKALMSLIEKYPTTKLSQEAKEIIVSVSAKEK